jgi:hypothetical protein
MAGCHQIASTRGPAVTGLAVLRQCRQAHADPVNEPTVYAGVSAEQHFGRHLPCPAAMLMMPRDQFGEMMASQRSQADGNPLWTTDFRPRSSERM